MHLTSSQRILTIKQLEAVEQNIHLWFSDAPFNLICPPGVLENKFAIDRSKLAAGQELLIEGHRGIQDADLWCHDPIATMQLLPAHA